MRPGGKHYRRSFLSTLAIVCAAVVVVALFASNRLHAIRFEASKRTLWEESRLVFQMIEEDLRHGRAAGIQATLAKAGSAIGCRFTVIDSEGGVIADTEANPGGMENHRLRPEIIAAAAQGEGASVRFSQTVQKEMMYLARCEQGPAGNTIFIRLAVPVSDLYRNLQVFDMALAIAALFVVLIAGVACHLMARRQAERMASLQQVSEALAGGDTSRRANAGESGSWGQMARNLNVIGDSVARIQSQAAKGRSDLDAVLSSMSDGLIATDLQQRVILANSAAGALLDFKIENAAGKMLWEVIQHEEILKAAARVTAAGPGALIQSAPRRGRYIEVAVTPLAHDNRNDGVLIVARDTTQATQYQELRKEFVANVSHELRTPLTFIKGYVETLREGALADPVKGPEYLMTIEKHVGQLTNLVDDLLEISKLESRAGLPRRVGVNLADTIRKVVELLGPAAARKEQRLAVEAPAAIPAVSGDPDYLERAISNLVDNAVKYTPAKGSIRLSAASADGRVIVEVSDTGIGIPAEDIPRIFERFYRVDKSRSRDMGGTGLGLAIVKHIAQAHGGAVEVASEPGKGSVFRIILPAQTGA